MRPRSDPGQSPDALISSARLRIASRSIFFRAWYGFGRMSLMGTTTFMRTPPPMPQPFSREWLNTFYHTGARAVKQSEPRATTPRRAVFAAAARKFFARAGKRRIARRKKFRARDRRCATRAPKNLTRRKRGLEYSSLHRSSARVGETRASRERAGGSFTIL